MQPESNPDTPLPFTPAALGADPEFADWPTQDGWWPARRAGPSVFHGKAEERAPAAE